MSDQRPDPLWDGQGPQDPDVARLMEQLAVYRHRPRRRVPWGPLALAAAAAALVGVAVAWWPRGPDPWASTTAACDGCVWAEGSALDTTGDASALLALRGQLQASAGTVLTRLPAGDDARLALSSGSIRVQVAAPARWLVVELPGVDLVDLGCAYEARVDAAGHGWVSVDAGQVALEGRSVARLPAGTLAATWPDGRVGLPVPRDASPALIAAVDGYARGSASASDVLASAVRPADAVTVWNLLLQVPATERDAVLDALDDVLPGDLRDRDAVRALDPAALDASFAYLVGATL